MELIDKTPQEQKFHMQMLIDVKSILDKHKITNILAGSGLLGIVRDSNLIPWSPGVILIVFFDQIKEKNDKIISDLKEKGFKITRNFKKAKNYKIRVDKGKFNIEITGYSNHKKYYFRSSGKRIKTIPKKYLQELGYIEFQGNKFTCPQNIDGFLTHLYGNWKIVVKSKNRHDYKAKTHTRYK